MFGTSPSKEQLVGTERNGLVIAALMKSETGLPTFPQLLWEWKAVFNPNTFSDPSLTVRADITGRYSNRLYTYEPQDMMFRKCPFAVLLCVSHCKQPDTPHPDHLCLRIHQDLKVKNKYCVRAFAINHNGLTCSSKTIAPIVPLNLLGLLK